MGTWKASAFELKKPAPQRAMQIIEPFQAPEIFVTGCHSVEVLGGVIRFGFHSEDSLTCVGEIERVAVSKLRLLMPRESVAAQTINVLEKLAALGVIDSGVFGRR